MKQGLEETIKQLLLNAKIPYDIIGKRESLPDKKIAIMVAKQIILAGGLPEYIAETAVNGFPQREIKCDGEIQGYSEGWNWCNMYDGYLLEHAINLANYPGAQSEVGMKYPNFNTAALIKRYKLTKDGQLYLAPKPPYEVWKNDSGVIFTFEAGRMGNGGYAGAIFPTHEDSYQFAKWYLGHKTFYIKDMDLYKNGLGGFGIADYEKAMATAK